MAIHIERLEGLAKLLDNYKPNPGEPGFDLRHWTQTKTRRGGFLWLQKVECGTAACAVGLACLSMAFESEGFSAVKDEDGFLTPTFAGNRGWEAVEAFFGLSYNQAQRLFSDDEYKIRRGPAAAAAVAVRIRSTIKRSQRARRAKPPQRTAAAVEKIKAAALEPV